jgi:NADPH:quinone reductase-like Zn-dependent oxidoreductase
VLVEKSLSFSRPVVFDYVSTHSQLTERAQRVWRALADGAIKPPAIERHPLERAMYAHARLESRGTVGPLILLA